MLSTDIPARYTIAWANSAGGSYIRTIPTASQIGIQAGAASLTDGFPPVTFLPVAGGGTPPFGQDFNGILNQITGWQRVQQAGLTPIFNGTFSTAIGGYPKGAMLASTVTGIVWISTADNNTTDPDGGSPANWVSVQSRANVWTAVQNHNQHIILANAIALYGRDNGAVNRLLATIDAGNWSVYGAGPSGLRVLNSAGSVNIVTLDNSGNMVLAGGLTLPNNAFLKGNDSGAVARVLIGMDPSNYATLAAGAAGWRVTNVANTVNLLLMDTSGNLTSAGRYREATGARGSGDSQAVVNLADFTTSIGVNGYEIKPDGMIEQWGQVNGLTNLNDTITLPLSFPNNFLNVVANDDGTSCNSYGTSVINHSQFSLFSLTTAAHGAYWRARGN